MVDSQILYSNYVLRTVYYSCILRVALYHTDTQMVDGYYDAIKKTLSTCFFRILILL